MTDWKALRELFPVTEKYIYMNNAGVAPISTRVKAAMQRFLDDATSNGAVNSARWGEAAEDCRKLAAKLIGADSSEIAFMKNTTQGIIIAANGVNWRDGDNVVTAAVEFPANVYPWWNLKRLGVETRMVPERDGRIHVEDIEAAIDSRTRAVTISHVEFASGFRNDIAAIGEICRKKGLWFIVDAIQSVGVIDVDVKACGVDILAADGHKWLLAPEGAAIFYCAKEKQDRLINTNVGWASVVNPRDYLNYDLTQSPDATRFEEGSYNTVGLYGLLAAIELLLEIGVSNIERRVLDLTGQLIEGLKGKGYRLLTPPTPAPLQPTPAKGHPSQEGRGDFRTPLRGGERGRGGDCASERSGIVVFKSDRHSAAQLCSRLREENIICAPRNGVRLSPHFYNTEAEIEVVLATLP